MGDETRDPHGAPAPSDAVFQRFDPPHDPGNRLSRSQFPRAGELADVTAAQAPVAAEAGAPSVEGGDVWDSPNEQVRLQANQLAGHLRSRLKELDRRESQLQHQTAEFENEQRSHRLWMREREAELTAQLEAASQQLALLQQQATSLAAAQAGWERQQQEDLEGYRARELQIVTRERQLDETAHRVHAEQQALEAAKRTLGHDQRRWEDWVRFEQQKLAVAAEAQQQAHRRLLARLEKHREAVHEREQRSLARVQQVQSAGMQQQLADVTQKQQLLQRLHAQLSRQCEELAQEQQRQAQLREQSQYELTRERDELTAARAECERQWQERSLALKQRGEQLDSQHTALERLQKDLLKRNREVLELRLATEQVQSRLELQLDPDRLAQHVREAREQLAEHFRWALLALDEKQQELRTLSVGLESQHRTLRQQQQELQDWLGRRQQELDVQAARLAVQREQVHQRDRALQEQERVWARERRELQQQLRELAGQFARAPLDHRRVA